MLRKWTLIIAAAALGMIGQVHAQEELKIGGIGPLSGGGTAWGLALQRGVQLAVDEAITAGGIKIGNKTYKPTFVMYDDQYTSAGGRAAADRLINSDKIKFIIGPIGSPSVLSVRPVTTEAKVILLSNGFAGNILKNDDKSPFNFRTVDSTTEFAPAMIKWHRKNFPATKKVALIAPNDAVGQSIVPILEKYYLENGYQVWKESYERGSKEFMPLLTRMMSQNVDLLDLNSNAPGEAGLMLKQARQAGFNGMIWQVGGPSIDEIIDVAGPMAEGFVSFNVTDFNAPETQNLIKAYQAKWGMGVMNAQVPLWYNATRILFEALRRAGTTDTVAVRDTLERMEGYDAGLFGPVSWGGMADYGVAHQLLLKFWISEVKNGKIVTRATVTPDKR